MGGGPPLGSLIEDCLPPGSLRPRLPSTFQTRPDRGFFSRENPRSPTHHNLGRPFPAEGPDRRLQINGEEGRGLD